MAHELTKTESGEYELAYVGNLPWHGHGQLIKENATVEEVAVAARMNWTIQRSPILYTPPGTDIIKTVPNKVVLHRNDNHKPLGVVSSSFNEIQPIEVIEFWRDVIQTGDYTLESAGTMRDGARMFAMVRTTGDFELAGGDTVTNRLLFHTGCDGLTATQIKPTTIRVICANTAAAALDQDFSGIKIYHSTKFVANTVKEELRKFDKTFDSFRKTAEILSNTAVSTAKVHDFLAALLRNPVVRKPVEETKGYKTVIDLFNGAGKGSDLPSARGTAWGLFNAVTEYADHYSKTRDIERREESALFGSLDNFKSRALSLLVA
jgi:phage/plasmid-like protein (TIGR03299 family)